VPWRLDGRYFREANNLRNRRNHAFGLTSLRINNPEKKIGICHPQMTTQMAADVRIMNLRNQWIKNLRIMFSPQMMQRMKSPVDITP
jgi:hypothetical protein